MGRFASALRTWLYQAIGVYLLFAGAPAALADSLPAQHQNPPAAAQLIRAVLAEPEDQLDFARAKLTFDKMIDPSIDIDAWMRKIDQMVQVIQGMAGPSASNWEKLGAVRKYIYDSGEWNDHNPYQYDLTDPLGTKITNKLLPTYISNRRGNCVSMPILFLILG